jgi:hypothetical protein
VVHRPHRLSRRADGRVDPASRRAFWELIYELAQASVTVSCIDALHG